ncbi:MAG TPA: DEAD/DEAH box helicase [Gemmataceae bacterium]|nr:DEAD/DEAH box helicase [Gemmataceae bacterium]
MNAPSSLRPRGLQLLRTALNDPVADFRDGQWESIEALVQRRARLLLVQRTGWGKSAGYFLSTRLLRDQRAGPTLLVSPLLALMRNQIDAAVRLGVRAETVNSTNADDWQAIEQRLRADEIDVLIVSPERFANETFLTQMLLPHAARVGLFVVDEAHCISDWGHDFRPDYRRIVRILERLPANVPVCATTATANNRVVADVVAQLGFNVLDVSPETLVGMFEATRLLCYWPAEECKRERLRRIWSRVNPIFRTLAQRNKPKSENGLHRPGVCRYLFARRPIHRGRRRGSAVGSHPFTPSRMELTETQRIRLSREDR